jgi:hypothetical protein
MIYMQRYLRSTLGCSAAACEKLATLLAVREMRSLFDQKHNLIDFVSGTLRLAFHDAAEYVPGSVGGSRSDGCINLGDKDNTGLDRAVKTLDQLWRPVCNLINRADFWYLAAKIAVETATPYISGPNQYRGTPALNNFHIPFYIGRVDVPQCVYNDTGRLPSANKGGTEVKRVLMKSLGLTDRQAVALMGGHSVGGLTPEDNGFLGAWSVRSDLFTTNYYKLLTYAKFLKMTRINPRNDQQVFQWNVTANLAFLTTDIGMLYDLHPNKLPSSCGPSSADSCPTLGSRYPDLAPFASYVALFSRGDQGQDMPGAAFFLSEFSRALNAISMVGYNSGALSCVTCASPNCAPCTKKEMCEGPQYGFYGSP